MKSISKRSRPLRLEEKELMERVINRFLLACLFITPALIGIIYMFRGGRFALFAMLFLSIAAFYFLGWSKVLSKKERSLTVRALYFLTALTVSVPFLLSFEPSLDIRLNNYLDLAINNPFMTLMAGILPGVPFVVLALRTKPTYNLGHDSSLVAFGRKISSDGLLTLYLCVAVTLLTTFIFAFFPKQNIFYYLGRVLTSMFYFAPFFLGLVAYKYRSVYLLVGAMLLALLAYSTLTGNRGIGFNSAAAFIMGDVLARVSTRGVSRNLLYILNIAIVLIFLAFFAVKSGELRNHGGRIGISELSAGETIFSRATMSANPYEFDTGMTLIGDAATRIVRWPYYVIPWIAPRHVPLLGLRGIGEELSSALRLPYIGSGKVEYDNRRYLQEFGLAVHYDEYDNRTSSVPLPLFVDGYLRFGWLGGLLYTFVFLLILKKTESFCRYRLRSENSSDLLVLLWLFSVALSASQINGLFLAIRWLIFSGIVVFLCILALRILRKRFSNKMRKPDDGRLAKQRVVWPKL